MDNRSIFTAELMHNDQGNGAFRLLFAQEVGSLIENAAQLIDVGKMFIFTKGDTAGNYLVELNRAGMSNRQFLEAARNPFNFQPILTEFAGNVLVSNVIIRTGNIINGTFSQTE